MEKEDFYIQLLELKNDLEKSKTENIALHAKLESVYKNWKYDYERFTELKKKCKLYTNIDNLNLELSYSNK
jgi:hypothetical protein